MSERHPQTLPAYAAMQVIQHDLYERTLAAASLLDGAEVDHAVRRAALDAVDALIAARGAWAEAVHTATQAVEHLERRAGR